MANRWAGPALLVLLALLAHAPTARGQLPEPDVDLLLNYPLEAPESVAAEPPATYPAQMPATQPQNWPEPYQDAGHMACPDCHGWHGLGKRCGRRTRGVLSSLPAHIKHLEQPLQGTSWLNRPHSFGVSLGLMLNDELIGNHVDLENSILFNFRYGWDWSHHWGSEVRAAFSDGDLDYGHGIPTHHQAFILLGDFNMLYYPLGDTAFRPYFLLGAGFAQYDFTDDLDERHDVNLLGLPIGMGVKYYVHPTVALRLELLDNLAIGSDHIRTMNNVSLTLGVEWRFGGTRRLYYPWQPSRNVK